MDRYPAEHRPPSSLEVARLRDARIVWLLSDHPVTASQLSSLGWFPSRAKAQTRLRKLARRGRIHLVGTLSRRGGRPEHVYCRWRPQPLQHEVELTDVCLQLNATEVRRGPSVRDRFVLPDAEVVIAGETYYLELDRGTMSHAQMARRFRLYEEVPHLSLWVCSTAERRDALRAGAARLRSTALFATLDDVRVAPCGAVWVDVRGNAVSLHHREFPNQEAASGAEDMALLPPSLAPKISTTSSR